MAPNPPPPGHQPPGTKSAVINKCRYNLSHESCGFYFIYSCFYPWFMDIINLNGLSVKYLHFNTFLIPGLKSSSFWFVPVTRRPATLENNKNHLHLSWKTGFALSLVSSPLAGDQRHKLAFCYLHFTSSSLANTRCSSQSLQRHRNQTHRTTA